MKKIGLIGIGGRTGSMFAFELREKGEIIGIGKREEINLIKEKKVFIKKGEKEILFKGEVMEDSEFPKGIEFDFLFLTVKNPVKPAVKYYYQRVKEKNLKLPVLFLSQNGIEAFEEALSSLKEILGEKIKEISIFRISLFNPVDKKILGEKFIISYSLPIRLAISRVFGNFPEKEVLEIFQNKNFKVYFVPSKDSKNMEYSKLFLNLIGMASATHNLSIKEGFSKKEIFEEEILALREYKRVVKLKKGKFLNFPHYPIKIFSFLISLPLFVLFPFRKILAKLLEKGRSQKPKELDEIDYYNGAVVKLGKELGIETPINSKILERAKRC